MQPDIATRVADALTEKPVSALEDIAALAGSTVADVVRHLPEGEATCVPGSHFVDVMQAMRKWGEITMVVNTGNVILEAKAPMPDGSVGRGFYNLKGKPIGGHLKYEACNIIAFVSRSFMGAPTHSVHFYADDGSCMFKVYLGRDADRNFLPGQEDAFIALRNTLNEAG